MLKESKTLEFKKEMSDTFLKTVSAFANFGTGTIMFGVDDEGIIVGVDNMKNLRLDIENKINSNIEPIPDYYFEEDEKNKVLKLIVEEGVDKPYFYKSKSYMRRDTSTIEMDKSALRRLVMKSEGITYDSLKSFNQNLKFSVLEKALKEKMKIEVLGLDVMKTLELYSEKEGYNRAAELLSDVNRYEGIDIARFGDNINIFLDRIVLNRISILDQYDKALEKFRQYYTYEEIKGAERISVEKISENAFREAIANALVNRDWDSTANIQVSFYDDKIEIISPGGLPEDITEKEYFEERVSKPRNVIIGNVFFRLGLIERYGTGVQRIKEEYKDYYSKPLFKISENFIKIVLPLIEKDDNYSEKEKKIINSLKNSKLSSSEIIELTGIKKTTLVELLNSMTEKGYIAADGNGKNRRYYLTL